MAYTGLRWGEVAALKVRRVDLLHGRIQVAGAMTEVSGRALFGSTKTHAHRSMPVPRFLRDDLAQQLAGKAADDLVFTSLAESVLRVGNWRRQCFDRAARDAGLDLTPHELRHTAASLAIASCASIKSAQRMLGHNSAVLNLDLYGHMWRWATRRGPRTYPMCFRRSLYGWRVTSGAS